MSTFNNNKGNNNTKKARTAAGTSAKKVFNRHTAAQVERAVDANYRKGSYTIPPVDPLYLVKATDAERASALKALPIPATEAPAILLAIDLGYHRDPRMYAMHEKQKNLTAEFDLERMDAILVSYRDGILWVVDGARCLFAAIEAGVSLDKLPIKMNTGWTREHEAEVYGEQNKNRILVSPGQQYTANLVAKDRTALLVQLICKQFNLTVCPSSARNVARPLRAVATAMDIVEGRFGEKSGKYTFSWMLSIMENVNWFEDRTFLLGAVSSVFLNAFAAVMVEADKAGKITGYTNNLHRTLVQLSPQLVRAYGRVQYPLMSAQGSTNTILKEIGRGALKATDILKVVNL